MQSSSSIVKHSNNTVGSNNLLLEYDNHVFIFTSSGKPVYTRQGTTHEIADLFALLLVFMNMSREYDKETTESKSEASPCYQRTNNVHDVKHVGNDNNNKVLTCTSIDICGRTVSLFFYNAQHMYYVLSTLEYVAHTSEHLISEVESETNSASCLHQSECAHDNAHVFSQPQRLLRRLHRFVLSLVPNINDILSSSPSFDVQRLFSAADERLLESIIASHEGVQDVSSWSLLPPNSVVVAESIALPSTMRKELEAAVLSSCTEVLNVKNVKSSWLVSLLLSSSSSSTQTHHETSTKTSFASGDGKNIKDKSSKNSRSRTIATACKEETIPHTIAKEAANHLFTYVLFGNTLLSAVSTSPLTCHADAARCTSKSQKPESKDHRHQNSNNNSYEDSGNVNAIFDSTSSSFSKSLGEKELSQNVQQQQERTSLQSEASQEKRESLTCALSAEDTQLLFHFARNVAKTSVNEAWFPLCLPDFNELGFVWIYVANLIDMLTEKTNANCPEAPLTESASEESNTPETIHSTEDHARKVHQKETREECKLLLIQVTASDTSFDCCAYLASRLIYKLTNYGQEWIRAFISSLSNNNNICKKETNTNSKLILSQEQQKQYSEPEGDNNMCDCMMHNTNEAHVATAGATTATTKFNGTDVESINNVAQSFSTNEWLQAESSTNKSANVHGADHCIRAHISERPKECVANDVHYVSKLQNAKLLFCVFATNSHFSSAGNTSYLTVPCVITKTFTFTNSNNIDISVNKAKDNFDSSQYINMIMNNFRRHEADLYSSPFTFVRESCFTYLLYTPTQKLIEKLLDEFYAKADDTFLTGNKNERSKITSSNQTTTQQHEREHEVYRTEFAQRCERLIQKILFVFTTCLTQQEMIKYSLEYLQHIVAHIDSITVKQFIMH